ncbi:hypothetical protein EB796_008237 [Bugula neritina]|uniref:Uncharacterized protein n=1 Tax=Bugula neritina TaxID=10212 RepID=A0A7J7K5K3_BUGNE|nr:hypothetical protein EB796_008237 [Bugula neritina]
MYWNSFCLLAVVLLATGAAQPQPPSHASVCPHFDHLSRVEVTSIKLALASLDSVPTGFAMSDESCTECVILADRAIEYFTTFKFFKQFQKENIPKPWKAAGIRSCDEFVWAYQCFQHCKNDLEVGVSYSYPKQYKHLEVVISKYCESEWPVDGAVSQCRMADTRACDMLHNKQSCGHHLTDYVNCIDNVLKESGLDCSGCVHPPAVFTRLPNFSGRWSVS